MDQYAMLTPSDVLAYWMLGSMMAALYNRAAWEAPPEALLPRVSVARSSDRER
jgi:hypothetical protein